MRFAEILDVLPRISSWDTFLPAEFGEGKILLWIGWRDVPAQEEDRDSARVPGIDTSYVAYKNTMNDDSQFCVEEGMLSPICAPASSLVLRNKFQCAKYQESMTCSLLERTKKMENSPKIEKGLDVEQPHIESSCMEM